MPSRPPALVPVVDLASPAAAADLATAASTLGCAYLTHHGIPAATRDALFGAARAFFAQPAPEKALIAVDSNFRGYTPLGGESLGLAASAGDGPGQAGGSPTTRPPPPPPPLSPPPPAAAAGGGDRKEGLYFGRDAPPGHPLPLHGPNQWPRRLPGFKAAVQAAQVALEACAERLVPLLGAGLGKEAGAVFARAFLTDPPRAMAFLRPLHYPPLAAAAAVAAGAAAGAAGAADSAGMGTPPPPPLGAGEHTDYGFLTLLLVAGGAPGLEVELPGGGWAAVLPPGPAPERPSSPADDTAWPLFFNCGDMLHRWSGGRYASARHRVLAPAPGAPARFSAAFFYDPPGDCVCAPVEGKGGVDVAARERWPPVRYLDYLQGRFAATHASYEAATGAGEGCKK